MGAILTLLAHWFGVLPHADLLAIYFLASVVTYWLTVSHIIRLFQATCVVPERVREALDSLAEGLLILDESERIVLANEAFARTVGIDQEQLVHRHANRLPWICSAHDPALQFPWVRAIRQGIAQTDQLMRYAMPNGSHRVFSINSAPIVATDGSGRGALATFRDVTHVEHHRAHLELSLAMLRNSRDEISRKNEELEILAMHDALTECLNRRAFFDRLEQLWNAAIEADRPVACAMIDIDHFKQINDAHGHPIGDEVLRRIAACLRSSVGPRTLVCRYGGEEFCMVADDHTLPEAIALGERIRQAIQEIRLQAPADLRLSASVGVAALCEQTGDAQSLIERADRALYVAKHQGRNRVVAFDPEMEAADAEDSQSAASRQAWPAIPFQAVTALVSALAYRDAATAEHSRRVADLCVLAADGLLDHRQTYILEIAALLHDIGKIGVPDDVLLKPGPLTDEEWQLMSRHDRIGIEIVASTFASDELSDIIASHRIPYGGQADASLRAVGQSIPVAARLLSIADSYDAMVSDHLYAPGRSHEAAVAELRTCADTQFDPRLVEHFVAVIESYGAHCRLRDLEVPQQTVLQIGHHIERLAVAVDRRDRAGLQTLAARLGIMARRCHSTAIASVADVLSEEAASEGAQWVQVLGTTRQLLDLCRTAQNSLLTPSARPAEDDRQSPAGRD